MTAVPATSLDLWIAGTMHSAIEAERRLQRVGISLAIARDTVRSLNERGLSDYRRLNLGLLHELFGTPVKAGGDGIIFDLALWPKHVYRWYVAASGKTVSDGGFRRRDATPLGLTQASSIASILKRLDVWLHTDEDITFGLGKPAQEEEWWPQRTLHYPRADEAAELVVTFDHGLLSDVRVI